MLHRTLLLLGLVTLGAAGEAATVLRGRLDPLPEAGLTVAVAKHGAEDQDGADGRLASAAVGADGAFSVAVDKSCDQYAVTVLRGSQVLWGRSHVKPGSDLGAIALPKPGGGIEGTVNGPDGKPLAGAKLRLWRKHDNSCEHWTLGQRLTADAEGGFALPGLSQGVWGVSLDMTDWAPTRRDVTVGAGSAIVELMAKPAAVVAGTVKDASGKPVADATVGDGDEHTTKTAADGTYRLGGLGEGEIRLRANAPGLALTDNAAVEVKLAVGKTVTADFTLQAAGSLKITVTMADPAATLPGEVQVELNHSGRGGHDEQTVPLKDGIAVVADLGPGGYQLQVKAKGTGMARVPVTITSGQELAIAAVLPRVYAYAATLTVPEGVDRAKIEVSGWVEAEHRGDMSFSSHAEAEVDAEGRFRFPALEAGNLSLSLKAPGCIPQNHRIAVGPGGESEGSFALARGATLRVRVKGPDGKPIAGANVSIDNNDGSDWNAETGEDGLATLDGLIDGKLDLTVEHDEWRQHKAKVTVPAAEEVAVALEAGLSISGNVLDADGKPIAEAYVSAYMPRGDGNHRSTQSGADGAFRLAGLKPGVWQLSAHADGGTVAQLKAVAAGAKGVKLQAKALADLVIHLLKPDGTPAAGVALTLDPEDGQNQQLTTDKEGKATARLRRGWTWRLSGKPEGFVAIACNGTVPLDGAVPVLELRLDTGRTLTGSLLGHDRKPVPGLSVALSRQVGRRGHDGRTETAQPDAAGAFTLAGLAPGPCVLVVTSAGNHGQLMQQDVLIPADGEPARLELVLPPCGAIAGKAPAGLGKVSGNVMVYAPAARVQLWSELAPDGSFRLAPVPAGSYTVMLHLASGRGDEESAPLNATCTVTAGADAIVAFAAAQPAADRQAVRGTLVLPEGVTGKARLQLMPDPDRAVTASSVAAFGNGANAMAGDDGAFTFPAVAKGRYLLHVQLHGDEGWQPLAGWRTEITVGEQPLELNLVVRGVTVPVKVLDPQGQPVEGANLTAVPAEGGALRRWIGSAQGITAADGTGTARWLEGPTVCDLMVFHQEFGRFIRSGVAARAGMAPVELRFAERVALTGKVAAPAGAVVRVVARSPEGFLREDVTADENGAYAFAEDERLHPGTWDVWAVAPGCAIAHRRLELTAAATADFALVAGGRIAVRVQAAAGKSALGLEPTVVGADGAPLLRPRLPWEKNQLPELVIAPLEADGSGEIDGLAPGRWTVSVPGAKPVTVEVTAGATATAELRLD